jgi:hypothetical protein
MLVTEGAPGRPWTYQALASEKADIAGRRKFEEAKRARDAMQSPPEGVPVRIWELRKRAVRLERPADGIFLRITDDGQAVATGVKDAHIPEGFRRFATINGLAFTAVRIPTDLPGGLPVSH